MDSDFQPAPAAGEAQLSRAGSPENSAGPADVASSSLNPGVRGT
jgi:hypothetical protein